MCDAQRLARRAPFVRLLLASRAGIADADGDGRRARALTVGTPDANGQAANSIGHVRFDAIAGNPSTGADEDDVRVTISMSDVRCRATGDDCPGGPLSDYTGGLIVPLNSRITDRANGYTTVETGTTVDLRSASSA